MADQTAAMGLPAQTTPSGGDKVELGARGSTDSLEGAQETTDSMSSAQAIAAENTRAQNSLKARKRTKTGCLTCRKRRIKCGEERPTCANCIKSKRPCEGYAPRVIFKDPLGAFRPNGWEAKINGNHSLGYSGQSGNPGLYVRTQSGSTAQSSLPAIAPRPSPHDSQRSHNPSSQIPNSATSWSTYSDPYSAGPPITGRSQTFNDLPPRLRPMHHESGSSQNDRAGPDVPGFDRNHVTTSPELRQGLSKNSNEGGLPNDQHVLADLSHTSPTENGFQTQYAKYSPAHPGDTRTQGIIWAASPRTHVGDHYNRMSGKIEQHLDQDSPLGTWQWVPHQGQPDQYLDPSANSGGDFVWVAETTNQKGAPTDTSSGRTHTFGISDLQANALSEPHPQSTQPVLVDDEPEDDYFDVDSDEERAATRKHIATTPQKDLGLMLALTASQDDRVLRSYTTFLNEPNVLMTYQPTFSASPLMDAKTARIFCHFITATGPSLSIYERHPTNPSVMFTGAPVPESQQSLWTYTLPMMALSHQALLHAMLALSSLHIAKLQKTSAHPSLKHYHYALRRIAKAVSIPAKRRNVATIAATLLLGFYEAITAEHSKWNSHLAGAKQLLMEVDFRGMTKRIKDQRAQARTVGKSEKWQSANGVVGGEMSSPDHHRPGSDSQLQPYEEDLDEKLISRLIGYKVKYDHYGRIIEQRAPVDPYLGPLSKKDIDNYNLQRDLFWWYCKQDVYQSVVSGNPTLMPYEHWANCPPRAPVGKLNSIYGTMDHCILLMGRIADFAAKDQIRKRKAMEANGGHWVPPPGMFPSPPPGEPPSIGQQNRQLPHGQKSPPSAFMPPPDMFFGMAPGISQPRMPEAFAQGPSSQQNLYSQSPPADLELETALISAEAEWQEIQEALETFEHSLGPDFAALSSEYMQPLSTPFGPALYYRTYSISCIWILFHTGRIILTRSHPSMHPAAMLAAGLCAQKTAQWANTIGQICAGLQPVSATAPLNPSLGAAMMESSLGLFFSGVQYRDPEQRRYTITALRNIALLTGAQSASLIAAGCETSWIRMGEAGRGPPYERTMERTARDDRVAGRRAVPGSKNETEYAPPKDNNDRRFVFMNPGARVHWAMGIMSMEEDFEHMKF